MDVRYMALEKKLTCCRSINQNNFDLFSSTQSVTEEVGCEISIKAYIPGMKMVLDNLKKELCRYFSVQETSENTGQRRKTEYPELTTEALKYLIPFSTSYLCELTFSSMSQIKRSDKSSERSESVQRDKSSERSKSVQRHKNSERSEPIRTDKSSELIGIV
ncbi:unnamed protein product [Psylliodes chrysocephalus]|uniref:HAT C-terminal dimerisation domain-containing protein n=1 Tax=Psylliodes chrysocephalus TaxID=3402493 RepID=A0A9P0CS10_9CUCU|nr:unnamed protein product [Psylliodes chrysocephala]